MSTSKLAPGTVLGRYELLLPIAQGGMATVWAARQKGSRGFSKTVAVKTMLPNLSEDATFEQMFLDEASIASRIHHPNVAEILDLGEQDEVLYLVMEWVDGESLSALAKQTKKTESEIPLRLVLKMVAQACAGLHAAHELRDDDDALVELVHRDISPQNILVSSAGVVKLVDFGVAKALGRSGATSVGQLKGKVPYMSPEQTRGHALDRRTDIFAMGSVLYRMVTGVHPFIDDNDIKTMRNIATRPAIRPRVKNAKLPVELETVVMKALEKSASNRYQTAAEMEADIEKVLTATGGPVSTDDVGLFVRGTLAERDQKRRAALRDAARVADEAAAQPQAHPNRNSVETVSDLVLTTTATPPSFTSGLSARDSSAGARGSRPSLTSSSGIREPAQGRGSHSDAYLSNGAAPASDGAPDAATRVMESGLIGPSSSTDGEEAATRAIMPLGLPPIGLPAPRPPFARQSEPPLASSPTLVAVATGSGSVPLPAHRRTGILIGVSLGVAVAIAGVGLAVRASSSHPRTSVARSSATSAAIKPAAPPTAASTSLAETDGAPSAPGSGTSLSIDQLPDLSPPKPTAIAQAPFAGLPFPRPHASATPSAVAVAVTTAKPIDKPTDPSPAVVPTSAPTPTSNPWVPAVQEPGF